MGSFIGTLCSKSKCVNRQQRKERPRYEMNTLPDVELLEFRLINKFIDHDLEYI